jgi:integrase
MLLKDHPIAYRATLPPEVREGNLWSMFQLEAYRGKNIFDYARQDMIKEQKLKVMYAITPRQLGLRITPPPARPGENTEITLRRYMDLLQSQVRAAGIELRPIDRKASFSFTFHSNYQALMRNVLARSFLYPQELISLTANTDHLRYLALTTFMMETGCRLNEALAMHINDFNTKTCVATVPILKKRGRTGKVRQISISRGGSNIIRTWMQSEERRALINSYQPEEAIVTEDEAEEEVFDTAPAPQIVDEEEFTRTVIQEAEGAKAIEVLKKPAVEFLLFPLQTRACRELVTAMGFRFGIQWMYEPRQTLNSSVVTLSLSGDKVRIADRGIRRFGPHVFRASFINNYYRAGESLAKICALVGHANVEMTQRYLDAITEAEQIETTRSINENMFARR